MNIIKKNIFPMLILLVALAIIAYFVWGNKSLDGVRQDLTPAKTTISSEVQIDESILGEITKACYLKKTPVTLPGSEQLNDIEYIEVSYSEGAIVTGFTSNIPAVADADWGTFVGAHNNGFLNVVYSKKDEGETLAEQRLFKISEEGITAADYIEKTENSEGVLVYEDVSKITFDASTPIMQTDCLLINPEEVGLEWK